MSRVERKEALKTNKSKWGKKSFCIVLILSLMVVGIIQVDNSFRSMMLVEGPRVFQYERLNQDIHQVYFCGESFQVDEKKIRETVGYLKKEVEVFIETLKEQKNQFIKNEG